MKFRLRLLFPKLSALALVVSAMAAGCLCSAEPTPPTENAPAMAGDRLAELTPPSNDFFAGAPTIVLTNGTATVYGTNVGAGREIGEPTHVPGESGGASVWWRVVAPANGTLTVTTAGSSFDTLLAAYSGNWVYLTSLTQIAASNDTEGSGQLTSTITFEVTQGKTYFVAIDGRAGATGSISLRVDYAPPPPVSPQISIADGGGIAGFNYFYATAGGEPPPELRWQMLRVGETAWEELEDGIFIDGATRARLRIAAVPAFDGVKVRCVARNAAGTATSDPLAVNVVTTDYDVIWRSIIFPGSPYTGSRAEMAVTVINAGRTTWDGNYRMTLRVLNEIAAIVSVPAPNIAPGQGWVVTLPFQVPYAPGGYNYRVEIEGPNGWLDQPGFFPHIEAVGEEVAPTIAVQPGYHSAVVGETVTLRVVAVGKTPLRYEWTFNGAPISGATSDSLVLSTVQTSAAGEYQVKVTNSLGSTLSEPSRLDVYLAPAAIALAGTNYSSFFLRGDGSRWAMGSDTSGFIGSGTGQNFNQPTRAGEGISAIAGGYAFQAYVTNDGRLWASGENRYGTLGDGTTVSPRETPVAVVNGTNVAAINAGDETLFFIRTDGTLWGTGVNVYGQLGDGTLTSRSTPVQISGDVIAVSASRSYTLFLKADGTVWGMGYADYLGDGIDVSSPTLLPAKLADGAVAVAASGTGGYYLKTDGALWRIGSPHVRVATGVQRVCAGPDACLFITDDGTLWGMGRNSDGQLGDGTTTKRVEPVQIDTNVACAAAVWRHSLFVKTDGSLWGMGYVPGMGFGDALRPVRIATGAYPLPPAPASVAVSDNTYAGKVLVSWSPSPHAEGYEVWRSLESGGAKEHVARVHGTSMHIDVSGSEGDAYHYFVAGINAAGRGAFSPPQRGRSRVSTAPLISVQPLSSAVPYVEYSYKTESFSVEAFGDPAVSYRWQARWGTGPWKDLGRASGFGFSGVTEPRLEAIAWLVRSVQLRCVVTNKAGSTTSDIADFWVQHVPVIALESPPSRVTEGQPLRLSVWVSALDPAHHFQWRKDSEPIAGGNARVLEIAATSTADAGDYDVVVTNSAGEAVSDKVRVAILLRQTISFLALPDLLMAGSPITLTASATSGLPVRFELMGGPAILSGDVLTVTGPGKISVRASQAGNGTYAPAETVDRSFTVSPTLDTWSQDYFSSDELASFSVSGPGADPDHDGMPNLIEYALGLDPKNASANTGPTVSQDGEGNWQFTYTRPAARADIVYSVEHSTNLTNWTSTGVTHTLVSTSNGIETWSATYPISSSPVCFFRLAVTR